MQKSKTVTSFRKIPGVRRGAASMLTVLAFCAIAACATGCATSKYSSRGMLDGLTIKGTGGRPGQLVLLDTSGYYLFWTIPLVSGNLDWNERKKDIEGGVSFFADKVGVDELQYALVKIAESRNCDLVDVHFYDSDTSYAGPSYAGLVGACFGSSHMGVSGVLVPRATARKDVK